mgnify:CR=1 FL=1
MLININGKDIGKELPAINVINPFNGECIDTVPDVPVELMDEAVKAAQEGLKIWGGLSQANRNAVIYKYIQLYLVYVNILSSIQFFHQFYMSLRNILTFNPPGILSVSLS